MNPKENTGAFFENAVDFFFRKNCQLWGKLDSASMGSQDGGKSAKDGVVGTLPFMA